MNEEEAKNLVLGVPLFSAIVFGVTLYFSENVYVSLIITGLFFVGILYLLISDLYRRKKATKAFLEFCEQEEKERLKRADEIYKDYQKAIKDGDKSEALRLGRDYYRMLRDDGVLTLYDEQSIANDLSSMG